MMRTRIFLQKAIAEEDPPMVAHFPQLARINKLGMITINSQALGTTSPYRQASAERVYLEGFVPPHKADEILRWMWANTDAVDHKVFADVGVFGVTTNDGGATWITKVRPSGPVALLRAGSYPSEGIWNSSTAEDRAHALVRSL